MAFVEQNAILNLIAQMRMQWSEAIYQEPKLICWQVKSDEEDLVDGFYLMEEDEEYAEFPEIFFKLDTPFHDEASYSADLFNQLKFIYDETMKYYTPESMPGLERWNPLHQEWNEQQKIKPNYALDNINQLVNCFEGYDSDNMIVYLAPFEISDSKGWRNWLKTALKDKIPERLILMVRDIQQYPYLNSLERQDNVLILRTNFNMFDAMKREAAGSGDPTDPGVQFRMAMLNMAEATGKGDISDLKNWGSEAVKIAKKINKKDLETIAYINAGTQLLNLKKREEALAYFQKGIVVAEELFKSGDQGGANVASQAHAAEASVHFLKKDYEKAFNSYLAMINFAKKENNKLSLMEAFRMAATSMQLKKEYEKAYEYFYKAFETGKELPADLIKHTSFIYVGEGLLSTADMIYPDKVSFLEKELDNILEHGWRQKLRETKT